MNQNTKPPGSRRAGNTGFVLLAAAAAFVFFYKLGGRGFENKDTVWYVETAWEMIRSGDWIVPRFNTVIFTEKPILFIWLVALFSKLAGAVTPFTARLPSALAAFGCVMLTFSFGKKIFDRRTGLLAGLVLCTGYAFAWEARACMVDMLFTFFTTLCLYLFYAGITESGRKSRYLIAAYFAVGLAALTKGPLGIIIPGVVIGCYLIFRRKLRLIGGMLLPWGILIIAALQAAWYVPFLARIGPAGREFFWEMYVYKENLLRFTTGFDHYEPFWFYGPAIFSHFLPWSPFLILYLFPRFRRQSRGAGTDRLFPAVWFLGILAFLTLSSGKHSRYALPLYPAAALLTGDFWNGIYDARKWRLIFTTVVIGFLIAWTVYLTVLPRYDRKRAEDQPLAEELRPAIDGRQLATYGLFSRRMALGFFLGRPVIYIDRDSELLDYLRSGKGDFLLLESAEYRRLENSLPETVEPAGHYRFRDYDLVLLKNR